MIVRKNRGVTDHTVEFYRLHPHRVIAMIKRMKKEIKDEKLRHEKDLNIHILGQWKYIGHRIGLDVGDKEKVMFS